jgi:hypothetical protein
MSFFEKVIGGSGGLVPGSGGLIAGGSGGLVPGSGGVFQTS